MPVARYMSGSNDVTKVTVAFMVSSIPSAGTSADYSFAAFHLQTPQCRLTFLAYRHLHQFPAYLLEGAVAGPDKGSPGRATSQIVRPISDQLGVCDLRMSRQLLEGEN